MVKNAEYEIITMGEGCNTHTIKKEPLSKKSYENERFVIPRSFNDKIHSRIRFLVVYKDKDKPVTLKEETKISSELLYIAESSNTLRTALAGLFRTPFTFGLGGRKLLFLVIIAAVGVIGYLTYTGQLDLGSILKM